MSQLVHNPTRDHDSSARLLDLRDDVSGSGEKGVKVTPTQRGLTSVADHKAHALIRRLCGPSCVSHVYAPLPPGTPSALPGLLSMLPPPRSLLGFSQPAVSTSVSNTHSTHLKLCSGEQSLAALDCSYLPGLGSLFFPSQTMTSLGSQKPHQGTVEGLWPADNKRPGLGILGPQLEKQVLILNNGVISRSLLAQRFGAGGVSIGRECGQGSLPGGGGAWLCRVQAVWEQMPITRRLQSPLSVPSSPGELLHIMTPFRRHLL